MNRTDNGNDQCGDYSNDVFFHVAQVRPTKSRLKGYYYCRFDGEFIKAVARKEAPCPFCGNICQRIMTLDSRQEQITKAIWKDSGIYSDLRADKKFTRKENGAA